MTMDDFDDFDDEVTQTFFVHWEGRVDKNVLFFMSKAKASSVAVSFFSIRACRFIIVSDLRRLLDQ